MKLSILLVILIGIFTLSIAQDSEPLDQQIAKIQEASPEQRVLLMNELKQKIAVMNAQQREMLISEIQTQMHSHGSTSTIHHSQETHHNNLKEHHSHQEESTEQERHNHFQEEH